MQLLLGPWLLGPPSSKPRASQKKHRAQRAQRAQRKFTSSRAQRTVARLPPGILLSATSPWRQVGRCSSRLRKKGFNKGPHSTQRGVLILRPRKRQKKALSSCENDENGCRISVGCFLRLWVFVLLRAGWDPAPGDAGM